jgi:hypothetical protein
MRLRFWIPAVTAVLSIVSTVLVAVAPGKGPPEARAVMVAGFAVLSGLMAYLAWLARIMR